MKNIVHQAIKDFHPDLANDSCRIAPAGAGLGNAHKVMQASTGHSLRVMIMARV
jgi:hypothetical protein